MALAGAPPERSAALGHLADGLAAGAPREAAAEELFTGQGCSGSLALPLATNQLTIGMVYLLRWAPQQPFNHADRAAATSWAQQTSRALALMTLSRRTERQLRELVVIRHLAQKLVVLPTAADVIQQMIEHMRATFGYALISVYLLVDDELRLQGQTGYSLTMPVIDCHCGASGRVVRTGESALISRAADDPDFIVVEPGTDQEIIVPLRRHDGEVFGVLMVESTGTPKLTEDDLELVRLLADHLGVSIDHAAVAERLCTAEQTLQAERGLFTQGPVVVVRWGMERGWPVECVSANIAQFGYDAAAMMRDRTFYTPYIHHDDVARITSEVHAHIAAGVHSFEQRYRLRCADDQMRWVNDVTVVRRDAKRQITHYDGYLIDITEQLAAAEQRERLEQRLRDAQKLESLGMLAAGVAHDFNNLLIVVASSASLVAADLPHGSPLHAPIDQITIAVRRATDLTQQILTYAGKGQLIARPVDFTAIVAEVVALCQTTLAPSAELILRLNPTLPLLCGDSTQLHQVMMNLIINALDALDGAPGRVEVRTDLTQLVAHPDLRDGPYARLRVSDTGCGMDSATQTRMFDPFFSTKPHGRGLGLAAALGMVRMHGGAIDVESAPSRGTTLIILLPLPELPLPELPLRSPGLAGAATMQPAAERRNALVVDDQDVVRHAVVRMVERLGYSAIAAASGEEAIELVRQRGDDLHLVLLDVSLTGMSGIQTHAVLRQAAVTLPIVLMSGYTTLDVLTPATDSRTYFLPKPFTVTDLRDALANIMASPPH